ncbi:MAG: hypothetical protein WC960_05135 [Bacteroidales bacterium]
MSPSNSSRSIRDSQREAQKRRHRKVIAFNDKELEVFNYFCEKYKIASPAKFCREAIITTILKQLERDHPTLF